MSKSDEKEFLHVILSNDFHKKLRFGFSWNLISRNVKQFIEALFIMPLDKCYPRANRGWA